MIRARATAPVAAVLALALGACAGPGAGGPKGAVARLLRGDGAGARTRAEAVLARRPGDPWARIAAALLAGRALEPEAEASHLVALATAEPGGPLALVALRRLAELAEHSPALARRIDGELERALGAGRFAGAAAYRARIARVAASEALGDHETAAAVRRENGAVSSWTLAGPFGLHRSLDFVRRFPPEEDGAIPASLPGPLGLPPRTTRAIPAPDGTVSLDGEPRDGDVFFLAADATLSRGGGYLLAVGTASSVSVRVDGAVVLERRAWEAHLPTFTLVPLELPPGRHRLLVKMARFSGAAPVLTLGLARADGGPSDAAFEPALAGAGPGGGGRAAVPAAGRPIADASWLAAELAAAGAGEPLASLLAARDGVRHEPEAAKALLLAAARASPRSAAVRAALGETLASDITLDPQVARARGEVELREALSLDPGDGAARVALAGLLLDARRLDEADEILGGLGALAARPAGLAALARAADARGLPERAEQLLEEALREDGSCRSLEDARGLAARRRAVIVEDERARALASCPGGRERLAEHHRRRGEPSRAREALLPLVRARPWAVGPALSLAEASIAAGDVSGAVAALEALRALWPRDPRVEKRLADALELRGDAARARAARERALLLDGSDLALRRALALEDGREVLDHLALDAGAAIRAYEAARRTDDTSSSMVLDAAAVSIHPGGSATERTQQVIHVLDQRGVEQFGEVRIPAGAQVLAVRTLKPDGRRIEPERAGEEKGTISLSGLEPGDYVEVEHLRTKRGDGSGFAADPFYFQAPGTRLFRSSYVVEAPAGLGLEVDAHGMPAPPVVREGGRDLVRGFAEDVPAHVPEPGAPGTEEFLPLLHAGVGGGREALHRRLAEAFAGRTRSTVELRALAAEVRAGAGAGAREEALVRAAVDRISRTILGDGGLGDEASAVLSRGRGGRLLLLQALLGELGIRARVAIARPYGEDPAPWRFAPPTQWVQPLLRVEAGGEAIWLDPALRVAPFGALSAPALDVEALVLPRPGEALLVDRTPARARVAERREVAVKITLSPDGGAVVEGEDRYFGAAGAFAKEGVERLDADARRQVVEGMLARSFRGMFLEEAAWLGEGEPEAPLTIRFRGRVARLAHPANGGLVLEAPVLPASLGARLVQVAARRTPLLVPHPERVSQRVEIVAPEGLVARGGPGRSLASPFGTFSRVERAEGRILVREDELDLARQRVPPERYRELGAFAAAVDAAQDSPAVFEAAPGGPSSPSLPRR